MQEIISKKQKSKEKLDIKDKRILYELDFDARISYAELGKRVGLSKQSAEYRVNNLIKREIVMGFYPVINMPKLGYFYCRILVTLQNITKEKQKEIINSLINNKKVFWLFEMQGPYDLLVVVWAKNITEFKEFIEELENAFGEYIKRKIETLATDVIHFQHRYLLQIKQTQEIHIKETIERKSIDALDKKIMQCLCENARMSLVEIGKNVKESAKVVAYRIKKLEKEKIIETYRVIFDHNKIGYTYYKLFLTINKISKQETKKLMNFLRNNHMVIYFVEGIGLPGDMDIEIMIYSNQELFSLIEELRFQFPAVLEEYQTVIFMRTLKVQYFPS